MHCNKEMVERGQGNRMVIKAILVVSIPEPTEAGIDRLVGKISVKLGDPETMQITTSEEINLEIILRIEKMGIVTRTVIIDNLGTETARKEAGRFETGIS